MFDQGQVSRLSDIPSRQARNEGSPFSIPRLSAERQDGEERFLLRLGFSKPLIAAMKLRSARNGTTIETELLASGAVHTSAYYGALARVLGLPFHEAIDPSTVADRPELDSQLSAPRLLRINPADGAAMTLIVPEARNIGVVRDHLDRSQVLRTVMAVTTPRALRAAVWKAGEQRRVDTAADRLFDERPELSARSVLTGGQGFLAGFLFMTLVYCMLMFPSEALAVLHVLLSTAFCVLVALRAFAIKRAAPPPSAPATLAEDKDLPVYTVLVALYREREVAEQLVASLLRLDWPQSRLDIKLVCEADDRETVDVLAAMGLPPHFEIVEVPDRAPRTKPKALNYGLAGARGDYLVIYDAEDRPHPQQLLEAYGRFRDAPPDVACLQAPLIISNASESWLSALFALEYSGLFRRLLPYLGTRQLPMPLGGTSNHFRTQLLREVGAWDPYNVTEDADLGMRLYRLGYRAETLTRYTVEDAPTDRAVWLGQRTRWFKGWMQTWLVLMRRPVELTRELGWGGTLMFHALVTGMLVSALMHPLILVFIGMTIWNLMFAPHSSPFEIGLFVLDWFNVIFAYTVFMRLGWQAMGPNERRRAVFTWRYVPAYWMLMSLAAWRAAIELRRKPYFWNKTPHKPSARRQFSVEQPVGGPRSN